jgi:SAM-dependent methyltransferase
MDAALYTFVGHRALDYANPLSPAVFDRVIGLMDLRAGDSLVDVGAGKGELCLRAAALRGWRCDAVERSPLMAAESRRRVEAAALRPPSAVNVHEVDAAEFLHGNQRARYGAGACIGSTHALGGLTETLGTLPRVVRQAGWAVVGEGYWQRSPPTEYLAATGIEAAEFQPLDHLVEAAHRAGLRPHDVVVASDREWDEYEWAHARGVESWAAQNSSHADAAAMLHRSRSWRDAYIRWGRGTLGFALLLCRVDAEASSRHPHCGTRLAR